MKKMATIILAVIMIFNLNFLAMAETLREERTCENMDPKGVGLNLTCPSCKGALGIIESQFYDISSGCIVYQIRCPKCEFYWEIWEPAAGFRAISEIDEN